MEIASEEVAFPTLSDSEMDLIRSQADRLIYRDGDPIFRAGDANIDFFVIESGQVEILNPTSNNARVVMHQPREFMGDIDLLTRRPVIVTAVARSPRTILLRITGDQLRRLITTAPRLGEKLIVAFSARRNLLSKCGELGIRVIGEGKSPDTTLLREFLYKNFAPHTWYPPDSDQARRLLAELHKTPADLPLVLCEGGEVLSRPNLRQLARCAGIHQECPSQLFDLAIVGAGPAGMTAAVYAASEGLSTVAVDALGPGGQAAGSSMIENFIGFPAGLTGEELATRGVLQMLKFGARLLAPVRITSLSKEHDQFILTGDDSMTLRARCVLIATGVRWRRLAAQNADRFERAGVYYAATSVESRVCAGEEVAVVGGGNSAGQAAMFLSECSRAVHMLVRAPDLRKDMSEYLSSRIRANPRIQLRTSTQITRIHGDNKLEAIDTVNSLTQEKQRLNVSAVFVFIGAEPCTSFLPPEVARDDHGYLLTGLSAKSSGQWLLPSRDPCEVETSLPGLLVAGDARSGSTKRVAFAVGDGAMAITCAHRLRQFPA